MVHHEYYETKEAFLTAAKNHRIHETSALMRFFTWNETKKCAQWNNYLKPKTNL